MSIELKGDDSEGVTYGNLQDFWKQELGSTPSADDTSAPSAHPGKRQQWYKEGLKYWDEAPATVNGVLGGFGHITKYDISSSAGFLRNLPDLQFNRAVDVGAGIGRVTNGLLIPLFKAVELVEPCEAYVRKAQETIKSPRLAKVHVMGMQDYKPGSEPVDCFWAQWALGHLPDDDLVHFLQRCAAGLAPGGVICAKENTCQNGTFHMDKEDNALTRCDLHYKHLFRTAGLVVVKQELQAGFPVELTAVHTYALRPAPATAPLDTEMASK